MVELGPLYERLKRAVDSGNRTEMRNTLNQLILKTSGQENAKLRQLRDSMDSSSSSGEYAEVPWGCIFWVVVGIIIAAASGG